LVLQTAGDLLLAEKQVDPALVYYERSLNVESNSQLQKTFERLLAERSQSEKQGLSVRPESGGESTGAGDAGAQSAIVGNESNDFTPSEAQQWLEQFKQSMAQGDFQEGLRWAGQLLERYPGSQMASWTRDKMYGLLRAVLKKKNVEEPHVSAWLKEAKKLDVSFLLVWIKSMHFSAYYNQGLELCSAGIDRWEKSPQLPVLAYWCGRMARNSDRMTEAQKYFELTIQSGPGTQLAKESGLFLGLIFYRQKKWKEAQEALAAVMSEAWDDDELECATRYWRWRSLQKMGPSEKERAQQVATELMERHPLRYYGLRARWESGQFNKNWLGLKESSVAPPKESLQIWMSESERGHWARLQLYLKAGWIEAAVSEWESIGFMGGREGRLFSAAVEAALFRFPQAMSLAAGLLKENEIQWRGYLLSIMFPREYSATIAEFSEHFRVDKTLIHSLVKQESAYNRTAKSHAQALGLMQLIPPTAREVAKNLRLKNLEIPEDLFQVRTNVRFGTYYLGRMLRFSNGHVPIALAAYNAGLGRIGRWLESRPALQGLREVRSSSPDDEVWIDEIPWGETRSYVKLILRNLIMYRAIYNKNVALEDIIWETGPASANSVRN
jgi:soluble lytic murein transglycosylase